MANVSSCFVEQFIIVSEPLSYLKCKFKKLAIKTLKCVLHDLYCSEEITAAKELLCQNIEKLGLDNVVKMPKRKAGENKTRLEVDDMLSIFHYVDENLDFDKLPDYVAKDVDNLPSVNVKSGDIRSIINRLDTIEKVNLAANESTLDKTNGIVKDQQKSLNNIQAYFDFSIKSLVGKKNTVWRDRPTSVIDSFSKNSESGVQSAMEDDVCKPS